MTTVTESAIASARVMDHSIPEALRAAIGQHVRNTVRTAIDKRLAELNQAPRAAELLANAMTPVTVYPHGRECRIPDEIGFLCPAPAPRNLVHRQTASPSFVVIPFTQTLGVTQAMNVVRCLKATAVGYRHGGDDETHSAEEGPSYPEGYAAACVYVAGVLGDSARRLCVYERTGERHLLLDEHSPGWTLHVMDQMHMIIDAAWSGDAWENATTLWGRA